MAGRGGREPRPRAACPRRGRGAGRCAADRCPGASTGRRRAPKLSCTWKRTTSRAQAAAIVDRIDPADVGRDVQVPEVEQHPGRRRGEPADEVADRERVVAHPPRAREHRREVLDRDGDAKRVRLLEVLRQGAFLEQSALPDGLGVRPVIVREVQSVVGDELRAGLGGVLEQPGEGPVGARRAGAQVVRRVQDEAQPRRVEQRRAARARATRSAAGSCSTARGGAWNWTQRKPAPTCSASARPVGHCSRGTLRPSRSARSWGSARYTTAVSTPAHLQVFSSCDGEVKNRRTPRGAQACADCASRCLERLERRVGLLDGALGRRVAGLRLRALVRRRPRRGVGQLLLDGRERRPRRARSRAPGAPARAAVLRRARRPSAAAARPGRPPCRRAPRVRRRRAVGHARAGRRAVPSPSALRSSRTRAYSAQPPTYERSV